MRNSTAWKIALVALVALAVGVAAGCGGNDSADPAPPADPGAPAEPSDAPEPAPAGGGDIEGEVEIDGSSTVAPLTTLAAEEFQLANSGARVTVGISGTGGGFERFCNGETDLSNASRPITDEEAQACVDAGVEFVEFRVATDALTVVVNPENDWIDCITVDQLQTIWSPESEGTVTNWSQVDPSFPDVELTLAGPGTDSGTFDYFTDEINGEEGASRADYTASEDDNIIVQAVEGARGGTGYFGFSYFEENASKLKALDVDGGSGCVAPSTETALSGDYAPLARPLFVYANVESFQRPVVGEFMRFYLENEPALAEAALMVPLSDEQLADALADLDAAAS